jgi:MYXO-CTERM domain-containing protein
MVQDTEVQIGIHSYLFNDTMGNPCSDEGMSMRVDAYAAWIDRVSGGDVRRAATTATTMVGDSLPPQITILAPQNGSYVQSEFTLTAEIYDNIAVKRVTMLVDGQPKEHRRSPPFAFQVLAGTGAHTVTLVAEDVVGNQSEDSVAVTSVAGHKGGVGDGSAGCAFGSPSAPPRTAVLLLMLLLALGRRSRRRRLAENT